MILDEIRLLNFRNYESAEVTFSPGINVFIGDNAQGKTSLLEAIYILSLARSHRTNHDRELLRWESQEALVEGRVSNRFGQLPLSVKLTKSGKLVKVNHLEQRRLSDYIGRLNVVLFAPEDLDLVKGAPQLRRKFIDMELSQMSPVYLHTSVDYQQILKQRNAYLKQLLSQQAQDKLYLEILTEQVAAAGARIICQRLAFLDKLEAWASELHHNISQGKEELSLRYRTAVDLPQAPSEENIYEALLAKFEEVGARELDRGVSLAGPHRDDLQFLINGQDVQKFGSQGQQRTTVLSMKLAEIECMQEMTGEYPILLLDDVLSELDDDRQTHLLKTIEKKVQTFLTTTSLDGVQEEQIDEPALFEIAQGQVQRLDD